MVPTGRLNVTTKSSNSTRKIKHYATASAYHIFNSSTTVTTTVLITRLCDVAHTLTCLNSKTLWKQQSQKTQHPIYDAIRQYYAPMWVLTPASHSHSALQFWAWPSDQLSLLNAICKFSTIPTAINNRAFQPINKNRERRITIFV